MRDDRTVQTSLTRARPGPGDLAAVCPPAGPVPLDAASHFARRALLIRGLMSGGLDAAHAVHGARPAAELLGLLVPIDALTERYLAGRAPAGLDLTAYDFEPRRRELLAVVAALLDRWLGDDPGLWLGTVARAGAWRGTVPQLIESVAGYEDRGQDDRWDALRGGRAPRWPRGVDASAVLLAMAPPGVVEHFVERCEDSAPLRGILTRILDRGPLPGPLVDYGLGPGATKAMLYSFVRNPAVGNAKLRQVVLDGPGDIEMLQRSYLNTAADRALRIGCVRRADAVGGFRAPFLARIVRDDGRLPLMEPLLVSGDPELVYSVLRRINSRLSVEPLRWYAYGTLARTAGPEPVWALEQERVQRLAKMAEPVRASMASGDIAPILAAADAVRVPIGVPGTEAELGAPGIEPWPYTDLIREHVEGNLMRKRVAALLGV